ncbi:MAG: polyprenyl synthetase family protein [Caldilineaceae bacterium]
MTEEGYWKLIRAKSSPFFGAALCIGGLLGGGQEEITQRLWEIGVRYGEIIQINDDLDDAFAVPASPDWLDNHCSLPILYADSVAHPERDHFRWLRSNVSDPANLSEAQAILIRSGSVSYCIYHLNELITQLDRMIDNAQLTNADVLHRLVAEVAAPVHSLLSAVGNA